MGYTLSTLCAKCKCMLVFITDLDGTLLDADYSYEAARPAVELLKRLRLSLVLCAPALLNGDIKDMEYAITHRGLMITH